MPPPCPSAPLSPPKAAALLQSLCEAVPTWEYGALGSENSLRLAGQALQQSDRLLAEQGARLALLAWQEDPLDARLARMVQALFSGNAWHDMACALAAWCAVPEHGDDAQDLARSDENALLRWLERLLPDPAHGGFWLLQAVRWCLARPQAGETLRRVLHLAEQRAPSAMHTLLPELNARLWAQWALLYCPGTEALQALASPLPAFALWRDLRQAQCLLALGQREQALPLLHRVWSACPCHPNLILCLHDAAFPLPPAPADTALPPLALYSWNKADILHATLLSLRQTEGAQAPVLVLDNGCTDGTADMLRALAHDWPQENGGLTVVSLPVNIGAPAARNWLLSRPEVRERGEVLFLDDDLLLAPGWLHSLRAAAQAHSHAAVLGCCITDHLSPHAVQCADFFLLPPALGQRSFLDLEEHVFVHGNSMGSTDCLLTTHTRPCLSVSGCCHWLRPGKLPSATPLPLFDVRFSPSQFDDLERDLRLTLRGEHILYVGQTRVRHVQHSSLRQAVTRARSAHIFGNKIKLEFLHSAVQSEKARLAALQAARRDLLRKITRLASWEPA